MDDFLLCDDPLAVYLREMDHVPPLSREEEIRCHIERAIKEAVAEWQPNPPPVS